MLKLCAGRGGPVPRLAFGRGGETVRAGLGKHATIAFVARAAPLLLGRRFARIAQRFGGSRGARRLALRFVGIRRVAAGFDVALRGVGRGIVRGGVRAWRDLLGRRHLNDADGDGCHGGGGGKRPPARRGAEATRLRPNFPPRGSANRVVESRRWLLAARGTPGRVELGVDLAHDLLIAYLSITCHLVIALFRS